MIQGIIEVISTLLLLGIGITSFYTDINYGQIFNKHLVVYLATILVLDAIICISDISSELIDQPAIIHYLINFALGLLIAYLLFVLKIWGAGDAKLFAVLLLIPLYLTSNISTGLFPGLEILIFSFALAFVYIVFDTCRLFFIDIHSKRKLLSNPFKKSNLRYLIELIMRYLCSFLISTISYNLLKTINIAFISRNPAILLLINIVFVYLIFKFINRRILYGIDALAIVYLVAKIIQTHSLTYLATMILYSFLPLICIVVIRKLADEYSIKELPVEKLRKSMVLSDESRDILLSVRLKGKAYDFENLKVSRLSENDVKLLQEWKVSKIGRNSLKVLRQVPFAPFICVAAIFSFVIAILFKS